MDPVMNEDSVTLIFGLISVGFGVGSLVSAWMFFVIKGLKTDIKTAHDDNQRTVILVSEERDKRAEQRDVMDNKFARQRDLDALERRLVTELGDIKQSLKEILARVPV